MDEIICPHCGCYLEVDGDVGDIIDETKEDNSWEPCEYCFAYHEKGDIDFHEDGCPILIHGKGTPEETVEALEKWSEGFGDGSSAKSEKPYDSLSYKLGYRSGYSTVPQPDDI